MFKEFRVEYWQGDDQGAYIEFATFGAKNIVDAVIYADGKYGDVISVREVGLFFKDNE